jgi:hypothetical protein
VFLKRVYARGDIMINESIMERLARQSESVARAVRGGAKRRTGVLQAIRYMRDHDLFLFIAPPLVLMLPRQATPILKDIPGEDLSALTLSPAGTSIELEKYDLDIEAGGLIAQILRQLQAESSGGLIMDLLANRD